MTQLEHITDLLIEFDEMGMAPRTTVPDPEAYAREWRQKLTNAISLYASEVAREIFEEIEKSIADLEYQAKTPRKTVKVEELKAQCDWILHEVIPKTLAELKKKYTESEKDNGN